MCVWGGGGRGEQETPLWRAFKLKRSKSNIPKPGREGGRGWGGRGGGLGRFCHRFYVSISLGGVFFLYSGHDSGGKF